jgi:hypothetical protein
MLFTGIMDRTIKYSFITLFAVLFSLSINSCAENTDEAFSESVKVSLRNVGHQLLLSNQDSISLVFPVIEFEKSKYKLSFQKQITIDPSHLVSIVERSFQKSGLPKHYLVEVIHCSDLEVAYSYKMNVEKENTIIPCKGRLLIENCYIIEVQFINKTSSFFNRNMLISILFLVALILVGLFFYKRKHQSGLKQSSHTYNSIGHFQFYPEQNKLVKEAIEISLSNKECELLTLFITKPNQIIRREELEKKVWEDNGVFVGRSLDTYISKLRKKLKDDDSIKLTNIHGVGYKLEVLQD